MVITLPACYQRTQRLNYHALNDGGDVEALEDHIFKKL
jgi:hypothetical protein